MEKPQTSASITPTVLPSRARATARLAVTVDLPTPPLPEDTAMTRVRLPGPPIVTSRVAPPPRTLATSYGRSSSVMW